jgi:hypothetical protein
MKIGVFYMIDFMVLEIKESNFSIFNVEKSKGSLSFAKKNVTLK